VLVTAKLYEDRQLSPDGDDWSPAQEELWSQSKQVSLGNESTTVHFESSTIPHVQLWTAETPNLYTLLVIQSDVTTGQILQVESCRVGFRTMEIREDGVLRVNGERIMICGINRHEHDPDYGKVVSLDRMKQDIVTLKCVTKMLLTVIDWLGKISPTVNLPTQAE
jgi:beta-galactosidase